MSYPQRIGVFLARLPDGGSHSDVGAAIQYFADGFGLLLGG